MVEYKQNEENMKIFVKYTKKENAPNKSTLIIELFNKDDLLNSFTLLLPNIKNKIETKKFIEKKKEIYFSLCKLYQSYNITEKQLLKQFAQVDTDMMNFYKALYPHGGVREGSGRKTDDPKSERFTARCTKEEKEKLELYLKELRKKTNE